MTSTSIDIDRPADQVFAYVTDPTQFHEWQQGVVSSQGNAREPRAPQGSCGSPVGAAELNEPPAETMHSRAGHGLAGSKK
jgi:hypothetical protein